MKPKPTQHRKSKKVPAGSASAAPSPPPPKADPAADPFPELVAGIRREAAADELAAELERQDNLPVPIRSADGTFVAGQSGNPAGRPVGSKNYVTEQRLAMEAALRDYMHTPARRARIMRLIDRVLEIGMTGTDKDAINAAKIMFDRVLSGAKQEDDIGGKTPPRVVVVIENMTQQPAKVAVITEGQFTEVHEMNERGQMTDDENSKGVGTTPLSEDQGSFLKASSLSDNNDATAQKGKQTGTDTP